VRAGSGGAVYLRQKDDDVNLNEYQRAALRTFNPALTANERLMDAAAGLAEEAGEVLGLVRKRLYQQREIPREKLVEELGDVLWCLAVTAESLGIGLEEVAAANVAKLQRRHPDGFRIP
jgi:NTP pyrophosphatase (non-canonical NTP hydrolase)